MNRHQLVSLFFIALLIFVLVQIFMIFSPFLSAIFWAAILAFTFFPLYSSLRTRLRWKDTWLALIVTILIILLIAPPLFFLILNLATQAVELYQWVTDFIRSGGVERLIDDLRSLSAVQNLEANVLQWEPLKENATNWILNTSKNVANYAVAQVGTVTKNFFILGLNGVLTCFLIFIFLRDGDKIYRYVYQIAPLEEENKRAIFRQINDTFSAVIRGQLLTSLIQAVTSGFIYWSLRLPAPIFLAVATFILTLIPFIGAIGIWLPLAILLALQQEYGRAIALGVFGIGVISLLDNILKPAIIGEKTRLPYFLLFFGILGGVKVYGLMGVFLGPVVISLFFSLVKIYRGKFL